MKYTLLEMVQRVAGEIKSDEITTLDETIEAVDIRYEVQNTFDDLMTTWDWEFLKHHPRKLDALSPASPAILAIPADVRHIEKLMYEVSYEVGGKSTFKELTYLSPADFHELVLKRQIESNVVECDVGDGVKARIYNDRAPSYFTSYDELKVVFDAYDAVVDAAGIDPAKTVVVATIIISSSSTASWTAPVPDFIHNLWFHESVARASAQIRGVENGRAERQARRAQVTALRQDEAAAPNNSDDGVNYGR